jgi:hypothetical protein
MSAEPQGGVSGITLAAQEEPALIEALDGCIVHDAMR